MLLALIEEDGIIRLELIVSMTALVPLPCLASQPEEIRHDQPNSDQSKADHQNPGRAFLSVTLLGLPVGTLRSFRPGLW